MWFPLLTVLFQKLPTPYRKPSHLAWLRSRRVSAFPRGERRPSSPNTVPLGGFRSRSTRLSGRSVAGEIANPATTAQEDCSPQTLNSNSVHHHLLENVQQLGCFDSDLPTLDDSSKSRGAFSILSLASSSVSLSASESSRNARSAVAVPTILSTVSPLSRIPS